jgi:hypothetical protein
MMVITCRKTRRAFAGPENGIEKFRHHLDSCSGCAREYRLFKLRLAVLDAAGAKPEPPGEEFFKAVRARIARGLGDSERLTGWQEDSWSGLMWVTARQLIPVLTMLLLLIIGVTLLWDSSPEPPTLISDRDRLLFNEVYEYPQPTTDDVLESLVALEDKQNGR